VHYKANDSVVYAIRERITYAKPLSEVR